MRQVEIYEQLIELVHTEHCCGCDSNTCDVSVSHRLGYGLWAVELFSGMGTASPKFDALYRQLGPQFFKKAEAERRQLVKEPHAECQCNAIIWLPDEVDYHCDNCGSRAVDAE